LNLSLTTTQNDVLLPYTAGGGGATFCQLDEQGHLIQVLQHFTNADGKYSFHLDVNGNPSSYSETLTATLGAGVKEGDRIALGTHFP